VIRKRLLGLLAGVPLAIATLLAVPASASTGITPDSFSGGVHEDNVKIQSGTDGLCLTYAHPVLNSALGVVPCNGSHNWDVSISDDDQQEVWVAHGAAVAVGDSGGVLTLKAANQTSDALFSPADFPNCDVVKVVGNQKVAYLSFAFFDSMPNDVWLEEGPNNTFITTSACSVHTSWTPISG
jgi:hypothetical protein